MTRISSAEVVQAMLISKNSVWIQNICDVNLVMGIFAMAAWFRFKRTNRTAVNRSFRCGYSTMVFQFVWMRYQATCNKIICRTENICVSFQLKDISCRIRISILLKLTNEWREKCTVKFILVNTIHWTEHWMSLNDLHFLGVIIYNECVWFDRFQTRKR